MLTGELSVSVSTAASASPVGLRAFAALSMSSSGVCFSKHDFPLLNQGTPLGSNSNSFACCLTITSSTCNHSKGRAVLLELCFICLRGTTSLCICGTKGHGLEGDLAMFAAGLHDPKVLFQTKLNGSQEFRKSISQTKPQLPLWLKVFNSAWGGVFVDC